MSDSPEKKSSVEASFVDFIIDTCKKNKGVAAALRRADNPATEYQSWEYLAKFGVDIEKDWQRLAYATIAAAIAKDKPESNGSIGIGRAIANCYEDKSDSDQAKAKLRRVLACDSVDEVCRILRPVMGLIQSKGGLKLDYAKLLQQLRQFHWDDSRQRVKAQWAQDFYGRHESKGEAA